MLLLKNFLSFLVFINSVFAYLCVLTLCTLIPVLVSIAFFTLAERKIMASIQRRRGPNVVGIGGLLQPFADGLKAVVKEVVVPYQAGRLLFIVAPCLTFILSLTNWSIIPFSFVDVIADLNYGVLYLYALSSFAVYGIILSGWVSQSKYPFIGAIRSAAQMISYEVSIGLVFLVICLVAHSLNLIDIVYAQEMNGWFFFKLPPLALIFLVSCIAETNRAPFDLPEAEAEIVAGYNLEYSSIIFALFFLGEYGNILLMSSLFSLLFLGGWSAFWFLAGPFIFSLKTVLVCFVFILVRATVPRYRYDQLMDICWQIFLPFNLLYILSLTLFLLL